MVGTFDPRYTYTKRGMYYFCKDVPADLRRHYTKIRIVQSLRTKSVIRAKHSAQGLVARLEDDWLNFVAEGALDRFERAFKARESPT